MRASQLLQLFPEHPGPERDATLIEHIRGGGARPLQWFTIETYAGGHHALINVMADALAIGEEGDSVRINANMTIAQQIADLYGCVLPTTKIVDLVHHYADVLLPPCIQPHDSAMGNTSRMFQHEQDLRRAIGGRSGLLSPVGKDWVITNRLNGTPNNAATYGLHDARAPNRVLWQPLYTGHNRWHVDYSQVVRLVARTIVVDGRPSDIVAVLHDPVLCGLVSSEGVIRNWRLVSVAESSPMFSVS